MNAETYTLYGDQPTLAELARDPQRMADWQAGRLSGLIEGIAWGKQIAGQEWTDATTAACRAGLALTKVAEADDYRRRPLPKAKTSAQIKAEARHSWRQLTRRNALAEEGRRTA